MKYTTKYNCIKKDLKFLSYLKLNKIFYGLLINYVHIKYFFLLLNARTIFNNLNSAADIQCIIFKQIVQLL